MAIKKRSLSRDPFRDIRDFNKKMQQYVNQTFNRFWDPIDFGFGSFEKVGVRKALSDIEDTNKEVIVRMDLPGVDKKDIKINTQNNQLEVSVENKQEVSTKKKNYLHSERSYTGFYRALTLPDYADSSKISATYKSGVLELKMPKKKLKSSKRILIK